MAASRNVSDLADTAVETSNVEEVMVVAVLSELSTSPLPDDAFVFTESLW
eukprot:GDKH01019346.1.p3 GENE.GDKH01019346.1~~GDKH01019346.1.p3  ORF type:complete len:50 (-),score=0.87 GDKH01019346.1:163-312(-)